MAHGLVISMWQTEAVANLRDWLHAFPGKWRIASRPGLPGPESAA